MPSLTLRNLDVELIAKLRVQAAQNGRSMEDEAREILRTALSGERLQRGSLAASIHAKFARFGGVELPEPKRELIRNPVEFE